MPDQRYEKCGKRRLRRHSGWGRVLRHVMSMGVYEVL